MFSAKVTHYPESERLPRGASFVLELRLSYFVIMIVFAASMLILIAQAELLDQFLARVTFR